MPRPHGIEVRIAPVALQQPVWWERVLKRLRYGRTDLRLRSSWNRAPHLTAKGRISISCAVAGLGTKPRKVIGVDRLLFAGQG